jgi:hypothetical protein
MPVAGKVCGFPLGQGQAAAETRVSTPHLWPQQDSTRSSGDLLSALPHGWSSRPATLGGNPGAARRWRQRRASQQAARALARRHPLVHGLVVLRLHRLRGWTTSNVGWTPLLRDTRACPSRHERHSIYPAAAGRRGHAAIRRAGIPGKTIAQIEAAAGLSPGRETPYWQVAYLLTGGTPVRPAPNLRRR